jgi:valyl-tRNA synthetase
VTRLFGADALRYTIVAGSAVGTDVILDPDDIETSFAPGRNFANKLWNAGRFILSNLDGPSRPLTGPSPDAVPRGELQLADRWILARCDAAVVEVTDALQRFRLNDAAAAAYRFIWSDLADWYIEQIKPRLYGEQPGGDVARAVVAQTFDVGLRLLHPVMPFITEALWRRLPGRASYESIVRAPWPLPDQRAENPAALFRFGLVQELVTAVRQVRAEYDIAPAQTVRVALSNLGTEIESAIESERATILRLGKIAELVIGESGKRIGGHAVLSDGTAVFVPLGDAIDVRKECSRLSEEVARLGKLVASQRAKLANQQFVTKAPPAVVERERQKLATWQEQEGVLTKKRELLGC